MVRVAGWLTIAVVLFAVAPVHAGGQRDLDAYQRAYGWYAPGQYVHDDHRYEHGAHGVVYRGTERPAWRWCDERGEWLRVAGDHDVVWHGGVDPAEVYARVPRHLHDPSLRAADGGYPVEEFVADNDSYEPVYADAEAGVHAARGDRGSWRHARRHARD